MSSDWGRTDEEKATSVPPPPTAHAVTPPVHDVRHKEGGVLAKTRVFISFDYDHDLDLKNLLVGQAKNEDAPFEIADWSVKDASPGWKDEARKRIRGSDVVAVICGQYTDTATGVAVELSIAQHEDVNYFLLWGRADKTCKKPTTAKDSDKMYRWTWENLKKLVGGSR
jgi:hypothetical protein